MFETFNLLRTRIDADKKHYTSSDIHYRVRATCMLHDHHLHVVLSKGLGQG